MYIAEKKLLPYDAGDRELGIVPWVDLESFMDESDSSSGLRIKVGQTLSRTNIKASERFIDPEVEEYPYERPFLFWRPTGEAYDRWISEGEAEEVDIALDTLHGFVAINAFKRELAMSNDHKQFAYYFYVGPMTRNVITGFVNSFVDSSGR